LKIRLSFIIESLFWVAAVATLLNAVVFLFYLKGISLTSPIMSLFVVVGGYFIHKGYRYPSRIIQLWTIFLISFVGLAYITANIYHEADASLDLPYMVRNHLYGFIITFVSYRFALYDTLPKFIDKVLIISILGCLTIAFTLQLGIYTLPYVNQVNYIHDRLSGVYGNPNEAAVVATLTLALSLGALWRNGWSKRLGILGILAGLAALIGSFSKTAILCFVLQLLLAAGLHFTFYSRIEKQTRRINNFIFGFLLYGIVQLGIAISYMAAELPPSQQERILQIERILMGKGDKNDTSNRAGLVEAGLKKIAERPFFGNGFGTMVNLSNAPNEVGERAGIHNIYFRIWGESGIFPILLYGLFWLLMFWRALFIPEVWLKITAMTGTTALVLYGAASHNFFEMVNICLYLGLFCAIPMAHRFAESEIEPADEAENDSKT
jgi:O-antigen ligase